MARMKRGTVLLGRLIDRAFAGIPTRLGKPAKIRASFAVRRKSVGVSAKNRLSTTVRK